MADAVGLVGGGDASTAVTGNDPVPSDNRVEVDHGAVTEWYVNGPFGLQQGFTVEGAPAERDDGPSVLQLAAPKGGSHGSTPTAGDWLGAIRTAQKC